MRLSAGNVSTKVEDATTAERGWLNDFLTYDDAHMRFARGSGDGRVRLLSAFDGTFPAGFTRSVLAAATEPGFTVTLDDARVKPCAPDPLADIAWLRDYQREAVDKVLAATRGILWLPTGSGKTEIAAALGRAIRCRWLFLAPQADLLRQTAERFKMRTGETAGIVGDGEWHEERVTVATCQTLARNLNEPRTRALLSSVQGIIVDECHTLPAGSFLAVVKRTRNAYWRVGLSGTPLARGDRKSLLAIGALGGVIHRIRPGVLIAAGVLSRPTIRVVPVVQTVSRPTYAGAYTEAVVKSRQRNATVGNIVERAAKPCFVFVRIVKHGQALETLLAERGLRVAFAWGEHTTNDRRAVIARLVAGELDVVVCSTIFQQALDVPTLASVVNAGGGASIIATLQRLGRGTRVVEGKTTFEVWDIVDRGNRWLERHSRERVRAYESEGYAVTSEPSLAATTSSGAPQADPTTANAEAEYRAARREVRVATRALTGVDTVRHR